MLKSSLCNQAQLESPTFQRWVSALGETPGRMHRKVWEYCFIMQALQERDMLRPERRGLGFAVGTEPLASYMCHAGAEIVATDLSPEDERRSVWEQTDQHADSLEALLIKRPGDRDALFRNCTFRAVDMTQIPDDLTGFDFCWSACAFEHLGTLQLGLDFVHRSIDTLRPGGVAVHTTEYNVSSNDETLTEGPVSIYRRKDIERLVEELRAKGHLVDISYEAGDDPLDVHIDAPPYSQTPHLKLFFGEHVITSLGLIITKGR